MRIVNQEVISIEEVPSSYEDTIKHIEKIGRICYKSGDKIKEGSAEKFCLKLLKAGHKAMIENSWLVIKIYNLPGYSVDSNFFHYYEEEGEASYIAGNWTAYLEYYLQHVDLTPSEFFTNLPENVLQFYKQYIDDDAEIVTGDDIPVSLRAYSVILKTDRAVTHELVRHRPISVAQESQRYVGYRNEIEFILPYMYQNRKTSWRKKLNFGLWKSINWLIEKVYKLKLKLGEIPQEARCILPNSTATTIAVTTDHDEWKHIFKLRCAKDAYPQIRQLMTRVENTFKERNYILK